MSDLHRDVFAAIHAVPRPITPEQALKAGMDVIGVNTGNQQQFASWMEQNGAKLCQMLNEVKQ